MKVLHIVSSWPTKEKPFLKPFIVSQIDSLVRNGVTVDVLNLNATDSSFNYIAGAFRLQKMIRNREYDIVHAHYSYCGWVAVLQRRVPVVVSLMGNDLFGVLNSRGGQSIIGYFNILTSTLLVNIAEAIIVKSHRMKELINADHVFVVPNGVDFDNFRPKRIMSAGRESETKHTRRILFLGDPANSRKNYSLALNAVRLLKKDYSDAELVTPFGISAREVCDAMNASDVLLFTSLQEGSPNVIKEAMACNLPIVSVDVGDVREVIGRAKGCYVTSFDALEIAEKLRLVLENGKRTNGRVSIRHLEINNIARKIIGIYRSVLKKKKTRKMSTLG